MKHLLLATACTFALAGASHAASFTFGADAEAFDNPSNQNSANGNEIAIEGTFDQVYNDESSPLFGENVKDGIMVQATATTTDSNYYAMDYETVLPMEGAPLASEGMQALQHVWAPCHNDSGIFAWNSAPNMSSLFVERASAKRRPVLGVPPGNGARISKGPLPGANADGTPGLTRWPGLSCSPRRNT